MELPQRRGGETKFDGWGKKKRMHFDEISQKSNCEISLKSVTDREARLKTVVSASRPGGAAGHGPWSLRVLPMEFLPVPLFVPGLEPETLSMPARWHSL